MYKGREVLHFLLMHKNVYWLATVECNNALKCVTTFTVDITKRFHQYWNIHYETSALYAYPHNTITLNGLKIITRSYRIETPVAKNDFYTFQNFS